MNQKQQQQQQQLVSSPQQNQEELFDMIDDDDDQGPIFEVIDDNFDMVDDNQQKVEEYKTFNSIWKETYNKTQQIEKELTQIHNQFAEYNNKLEYKFKSQQECLSLKNAKDQTQLEVIYPKILEMVLLLDKTLGRFHKLTNLDSARYIEKDQMQHIQVEMQNWLKRHSLSSKQQQTK